MLQPKIDGLSTEQRRYVAWAQMWSCQGRPKRRRMLAATDFRANTSLRGYAAFLHLDPGAFLRAFGTRPGDPMWRAPKDRVVIL